MAHTASAGASRASKVIEIDGTLGRQPPSGGESHEGDVVDGSVWSAALGGLIVAAVTFLAEYRKRAADNANEKRDVREKIYSEAMADLTLFEQILVGVDRQKHFSEREYEAAVVLHDKQVRSHSRLQIVAGEDVLRTFNAVVGDLSDAYLSLLRQDGKLKEWKYSPEEEATRSTELLESVRLAGMQEAIDAMREEIAQRKA